MKPRVAIITGASSGIGRAIAERFLLKGYSVIGNARGGDRLADLEDWSKTASGTFIPVMGDAAEEKTIKTLLDVCRDEFDTAPCIGVVSAGRGLPGSFTSSDPSKWEEMIYINILGAFRLFRMLATAMISANTADGSISVRRDIVVLGSTIGTNISPTNHVYGATKFAIHGAAEALRRQLGPLGIRVTLMQPGFVQTNFQQASGYDLEAFKQTVQDMGPLIGADDVARTVEFVVDQPPHVHIHDIMLRSTRQSYP